MRLAAAAGVDGMPEYTVEEVQSRREWTPTGETQPKKVYYDLALVGVDKPVNLGRHPSAPAIAAGQKLDLTLADEGKQYKATEPRKPGGGGGFGKPGYDPRTEAGVRGRNALASAQQFAAFQQERGRLGDGFTSADLLKVAASFEVWLREITEKAA